MKQIIIYALIIIGAVVGVLLINMNQEPTIDQAITISEYYSVVDPFQQIDVPIYLTNDEHILTYEEAYQSIFLKDSEETKKINVSLKQITTDGEEMYLGSVFHRYILELNLPVIDADYFIDDCYIEIHLNNQLSFTFSIGYFSFMHVEDNASYLFWTRLEALKDTNVHISRIYQIKVNFETMDKTISSIHIGLNQPVVYDITENDMLISIMYDDLLLYGCPIVIYYDDQTSQIIDYYRYVKENNMLQTSGVLNHVYDISVTS